MKKANNFFWVILLVLLTFGAGCTTRIYEGSGTPAKKTAKIETQAHMISLGYWMWPAIGNIDGRKTSKMKIYDSMRRFQSFEVLPGEHTLSVTVVSGSGDRGTYTLFPTQIKFTAEECRVYKVKIVKKADGKWGRPVIVDKATNQVVR